VINVVIDTNVVVSAALSPYGNPAIIIDYIANNEVVSLFYSDDILKEYKEVLSRPQLHISDKTQAEIIDRIVEVGILIKPPQSTIPFRDESDRKFYDTAKTSGAILITGNSRHYPVESFILTPSDYVKAYIGEVNRA
jgi:putative PIN family toxin of toxin-antitoxin system